ncbi:hypothetical protein VTO42DRAFT_8234 [Malbranchea cinnamomea]
MGFFFFSCKDAVHEVLSYSSVDWAESIVYLRCSSLDSRSTVWGKVLQNPILIPPAGLWPTDTSFLELRGRRIRAIQGCGLKFENRPTGASLTERRGYLRKYRVSGRCTRVNEPDHLLPFFQPAA